MSEWVAGAATPYGMAAIALAVLALVAGLSLLVSFGVGREPVG